MLIQQEHLLSHRLNRVRPVHLFLLMTIIPCLFGASVGRAQVVINELHYNPSDEYDALGLDVEFLELYNTSDVEIDLSGYSFTGIDLTFEQGAAIPAGHYVIVAPSVADAELIWNVTPIATYLGGLSGKGELIELLASDGVTIVDSVEYDDNSPWPGAPDGNGPSLELLNPQFDNSIYDNWGASTQLTPSPAIQNSVYVETAPVMFSNITITPEAPDPDIGFSIQVDIANGANPQLYFRVNSDAELGPVDLVNLAGSTWSGDVPGQVGGSVVRYRIVSGATQTPSLEDTINYHGVVIRDIDLVNTQLPVFQFYIADDDYSNLYDTPYDDDEFPVVVAYGSQVIDNARIRIRGGSSRKWLKKNFKVELPDGYEFNLGEHANYMIDEFAWQADRGDVPFNQTLFAWDALSEEGEPDISNFHMRLERNGEFYGLYRFQEVYDGRYRSENNYDNGELYKAKNGGWKFPNSTNAFEKKHPDDDDFSNIDTAVASMENLSGEDLEAWVNQNVDVPALINYSALTSLLRHGDQEKKNYYTYRDADTNRWSLLFWDLDQTWLYGSAGPCPPDGMTINSCLGNPLIDSVLSIPEFEQMHWRRTQSLVDKYLFLYDMEMRREDTISKISIEEADLDLQLWGAEGSHWDSNLRLDDYYKDRWEESLTRRRSTFLAEDRLPVAPLNPSNIVINEIHYNPASPDIAEFIELFNPNDVAIDISGWVIDGIGLQIRYGTVIPAQGYVVFTDSDSNFKTEHSGSIFIGDQYSGGLKNGGEEIRLLDESNNLIDLVNYDDQAPWPVDADGVGASLSLTSPDLENSQPQSWGASANFGGTPGTANDVSTSYPVLSMVDQSVGEGDSGNSVANVSVTLNPPSFTSVQYSYTTLAISAEEGADFLQSSGFIEFPALSTEAVVPVEIVGNTTYQGNRELTLAIESVEGGLVGTIGTITIVDNEFPSDINPPQWNNETLTASDLTHQSVVLDWSGATDNVAITNYELFFVQQGGVVESQITNATSYLITELVSSAIYTVWVEAIDGAGNRSTDGPELLVITLDMPDTTPPAWENPMLLVTDQTGSTLDVSWQGASDNIGVIDYVVQYGLPAGAQSTTEHSETSLTLSGLNASTEYQISIQARDGAGNVSVDGPMVLASTNNIPLGLVVSLDAVDHVLQIESASGQDRGPGSVELLDAGQTIELIGNLWKRVEIDYPVSADTVLQFDVQGDIEGEVLAIGLETNSVVSSGLTYQLWGSQSFGKKFFNDYSESEGQTIRYRIPVGELVTNRTYKYLTLISDQDKGPFDAQARFSNIRLEAAGALEVDEVLPVWPDYSLVAGEVDSSSVQISWNAATDNEGVAGYDVLVGSEIVGSTSETTFSVTGLESETNYVIAVEARDLQGNRTIDNTPIQVQTAALPPGLIVEIDGQALAFDLVGYGNQDRAGDYSLQQGGSGVQLVGNTWKYIVTDLTITPETVITFDFNSDVEGGVHGIAFENNASPSSSKTFKLYGSKRFGVRDFYDYEAGDGVVTVSIPVGEYLSGYHPFLVFVNDHDVRFPTGQSVFSNIVIETAAPAQ